MKAISILEKNTVQKIMDFMDRVPGLVSLTVTLVIVVGFIG